MTAATLHLLENTHYSMSSPCSTQNFTAGHMNNALSHVNELPRSLDEVKIIGDDSKSFTGKLLENC